MRTFTFKIADKTFNGTTASAKNQFEALHLAGPAVLALQKDTYDMTMVATLVQMKFQDVEKLISLLVYDLVFDENKIPVAENLFVDDIQNYYLLIAYVMRENLGNFWTLRRPAERKGLSAAPAKQ